MRPLVKYHGGKYYQYSMIQERFPKKHSTYVECFCGGANVLLNKDKSTKEVLSDINPAIISLLILVRDDPLSLMSELMKLDYNESTFNKFKYSVPKTPQQLAVREYVLLRMSRAAIKQHFAYSERLRNGIPGDVNAWKTSIENIAIVSERLQGVHIECSSAIPIIQGYDSTDTFFYCDPPYLSSTRVAKSVYDYEMSAVEHEFLSTHLKAVKGKVLLSGYYSDLYKELYKDWYVTWYDVTSATSQTKTKGTKREFLWSNYAPNTG